MARKTEKPKSVNQSITSAQQHHNIKTYRNANFNKKRDAILTQRLHQTIQFLKKNPVQKWSVDAFRHDDVMNYWTSQYASSLKVTDDGEKKFKNYNKACNVFSFLPKKYSL